MEDLLNFLRYLCKSKRVILNSDHFLYTHQCTLETVCDGKETIVEIYDMENIAQKSVPILYDKVSRKVVNNDSADILRMFSLHAVVLGSKMSPPPELYPTKLSAAIDEANEWIYHTINNGA